MNVVPLPFNDQLFASNSPAARSGTPAGLDIENVRLRDEKIFLHRVIVVHSLSTITH